MTAGDWQAPVPEDNKRLKAALEHVVMLLNEGQAFRPDECTACRAAQDLAALTAASRKV